MTDSARRLLLTVPEVAEALSLGQSKIYELVAAGKIESIRIGRARRIPYDALTAFIEKSRQIPTEEQLP